jgi:hypothetical protein
MFLAIKNNGLAYEYASDLLKKDKDLYMLALEDDNITDK